MNKICTTIEQSQKLIELGIDRNTADMCWQNNEFTIGFNDEDAIPAWSLSALIGLLPKYLKQIDGRIYRLYICNKGISMPKWECSYTTISHHNRAEYLSDPNLKYPTNIYGGQYKDIVDAVFEMVCRLKENEKI